jgi:ABC-type Fe2+-enterobactin transport system substrate-binding protein
MDINSESIKLSAEWEGLSLISARFPEERGALQQLFQKNSSFQSLCADYRDCLAALAHWQKSTTKASPALRTQYSTLLHELEEEVWQYLNDMTAFETDSLRRNRG